MHNEDTIDRVIDGDEVRTFDRHDVEVMILDSRPDWQGESFEGCQIEVVNPVPVTRDFDRDAVIGWATISQEGNRLVASIFIRYDCPERLLIETGAKMYPAIGGNILGREESKTTQIVGEVVLGGKHTKVTKLKVTQLGICVSRNSDDRIQPIQ
jgi:hypothetical protein